MSEPFPCYGHLYTLPYNRDYVQLLVTYYTADGDIRVVDSFVRHTVTWVSLRRAINNLLKLACDDTQQSLEQVKQEIIDTIYQENPILKHIRTSGSHKADNHNNRKGK